ncbi:MAG TPA: putative lipid II flippase FtsW [Candidatus Polarisedimenticolaceae bacterium]|nr:putative lipid II flippase FtsW [Candidatus Polarisedimenticolaceae bacterium]
MARRVAFDGWLFVTASLLAIGGLIMVGSASNYVALQHGSPSAFYWRHSLHLLLGFAALGVMLSVDYRRIADRRVISGLVIGCFAALVLVLAMPSAGGAHRWFPLGPVKLQPSEFAKLVAVLFMAWMLSRKEEQIDDVWSVHGPCLAVIGTMATLVVIEPDLGSAVMLVLVAGVMIFVAGLRWKYVLVVLGLCALGLVASLLAQPYRLERIRAFLDPSADALGSSFQLSQSLIAVGSGGLAGVGLGQGQQKAYYIPAAHTDFIFSVIGEELGLIGTVLLLGAFLTLFWRGMRTARRAPDRFGFYVALGLTSMLVLQALLNMGVCVGLLPTKGLPLPFISYGGSSLLASMIATGLLLNVSQHSA